MKLIIKGLAIVFAVFWILFILLEYWVQHPYFRDALRVFSYGGHVLKLLILGAIGIGGILYFRNKNKLNWINGLVIAVLAMVFMVIMADDFYEVYFGRMLAPAEKFQLILTLCSSLIPVYLIFMVCFVLGSWTLSLRTFRLIDADADILALGVGLCALTLILFFLGAVNLLHAYLLIPLLLLILGLGWRKSLLFLRKSLIDPLVGIRQLRVVGFISVYIIFVLVCMNVLTAVQPLALGYDSMILYVKLSSLINDYHGLVQGNLPYNWSLFISLGYLLFDSLPTTMTLCFSASILCFFAMYRLSRKWLDPDMSMLAVMLFATLPITNWLAYMDMKVDLGLLFLLLLSVLLFMYWIRVTGSQEIADIKAEVIAVIKASAKGTKQKKTVPKAAAVKEVKQKEVLRNRADNWVAKLSDEKQILVLLGLVIGFSIGIKISAIMVVFPVVAVIWLVTGGQKAFYAATGLGLFFVLAIGLDDQAGLGQLHLTSAVVQWVLLVIGIGLLLFYVLRQREVLVAVLRKSVILILCISLPMLPWLVKNYSESRSFSITGLTQGRSATPVINIEELRRLRPPVQNPAE